MFKRKSKAAQLTVVQPNPTAAVASPSPTRMDDMPREQMIAEAAYYIAQKRGFAPGYELEDWLAAEAEIAGSTLRQQQPSAAELH